MADLKIAYGTLTDLAPNLGGLANAAYYETNVVNNETDLFADALVAFTLKNHESSAPTGEKAVHVYAYAALDDSEATTDGTDGTEGTFTIGDKAHLRYMGSAWFSSSAQSREIGPFSVAEVFGGRLPAKWGIAFQNATGFALDATDADHVAKYRGVYYTSA